jgi:cyclase
MFRFISRLDIKSKYLVKGIRFEGYRKLGNPVEYSIKYENQGADEIHFQDVSASLFGHETIINLIVEMNSQITIPFSVGGGINNLSLAKNLFKNGADRISVNSFVLKNPDFLSLLSKNFGNQAVIVNLEVKKINNVWELLIESGRTRTNENLQNFLPKLEKLGAGEVVISNVDNDGTYDGIDSELLNVSRNNSSLPLIYHGGIATSSDIIELINRDFQGVQLDSVLHYEKDTINNLKNIINSKGYSIRI